MTIDDVIKERDPEKRYQMLMSNGLMVDFVTPEDQWGRIARVKREVRSSEIFEMMGFGFADWYSHRQLLHDRSTVDAYFLLVICPTTKTRYALRIPPICERGPYQVGPTWETFVGYAGESATREAAGWLFGRKAHAYEPELQT